METLSDPSVDAIAAHPPADEAARSLYINTCHAFHVPVNSKVDKPKTLTGGATQTFSGENLDLTMNYVGSLGFQAMIQPLAENHQLRSIIAPNNGLSNEVIVFFCRAFAHHPSLASIDFSGNPLSLPAALALVQLVHANTNVTEIKLEGTNIDEAALRRIRRALNLRRTHAAGSKSASLTTAPTATGPATVSPYQRVKAEFEQKHAEQKRAAARAAEEAEAAAPSAIAAYIRQKRIPPPLRGEDGWAVVNLFISTTPTSFVSELHVIHQDVIPKLNAKFAARKVWVHPVSLYVDAAALHRGTALRSRREAASYHTDQFACRTDHKSAVAKCLPLSVHLLGEKIGPVQYTPLTDIREDHGSPARREARMRATAQPIQEVEYEEARASDCCTIVMTRQSVLKMGVPPGLVELMTDNPHLAHPDPNFPLIRAAIAEAHGTAHQLPVFDVEVEKARWEKHVQFLNRIEQTHAPDAALVRGYEAQFREVDPLGNVRLDHLDKFSHSLYARLESAIDAMFPAPPKPTRVSELSLARRAAFHSAAVEVPPGRKPLLSKLDVYAVTPHSRNMALLCARPGTGNTTVLSTFIRRCMKRGGYRVAYHFCRNPLMSSEPSDPRSVFLSLAEQLLPDHRLPDHIRYELDIQKIKQYFIETVTTAAADGRDIVVLAIDGIDDLDPYVLPCNALRIGDTGVDVWNPPMQLVPRKPSAGASSSGSSSTRLGNNVMDFDWIPVCLHRSLRIIATTVENSVGQAKLCLRGQDSCDPVTLDPIDDESVDAYLFDAAKKQLDIELTQAELAIIRGKEGGHTPQYWRCVLDALQAREEQVSYFSRTAVLQHLPSTVADCCAATIRAVEKEFGLALARNALCLILLARWGVYEVELRMLLQSQFGHKAKEAYQDSEFYNYSTVQRLLRRLRVWLLPPVECRSDAGATIPTGGHDHLIFLPDRLFRKTVQEKYLDGDEAYARRIHQQLAHHFRRLAFADHHPLQSRGVKELPYHLLAGAMWETFSSSVISLDYIALVYRYGHGYPAIRELIRGYNLLDKGADLPARLGVEALKLKLREYIYFMRDHNTNMVQYPHMTHQISFTLPPDSLVHRDAKDHFKEQEPHFAVVNRSKGKLHRARITACQIAPSGLRIASCSEDRGIRICNLFGETLSSINQSIAKAKLLRYSPTSRYLSVVAEDHTLLVFDATNGSVISKAVDTHSSPVRALCMSARGRLVITGGEDRLLKVWESESGALVASVTHTPYSHPTSAYCGVGAVAGDPIEEDIIYSMCDAKLLRWKLLSLSANTDSALEQTLLIVGHSTKPLASFHIVHSGSYVITCAKDLAVSAKDVGACTEDNVKVWSLTMGRLVATMTLGNPAQTQGPVFSAVSPNEQIVATALLDGSIQLHELDCRGYALDVDDPIVVPPYCHLLAFAASPTPTVFQICFSFDSALVCGAGNERHLKVWGVKEKTTSAEGPGEPATIAEFLMDQPMSCLDWTQNRADEGGELIVGDAVGNLHVLRLIL